MNNFQCAQLTLKRADAKATAQRNITLIHYIYISEFKHMMITYCHE